MKHQRTISMESHAAATLQYIRASMEKATAVTLPGSAGFALGAIGTVTAILSLLPGLQDEWLPLWLTASGPAIVTALILLARSSSLRQGFLHETPLRKFAVCLAPGLFLGLVVTAVLYSAGITEPIRAVWLLSYGCALIAASAVTTSTIALMGGVFVVLGMSALTATNVQQSILMGIGFGGLHLLFGFLIGRENHRGR